MGEEKQYPSSEQLMPENQPYPGRESAMKPRPVSDLSNYRAADKLRSKVAIITGGDSGIGRAVAVAYAMEGADVAIVYNISDEDAKDTSQMVEHHNQQCLLIKADISRSDNCRRVVAQTVEQLGRVNILVNNAAYGQETSLNKRTSRKPCAILMA